jgi:hypothetical protein
VLINFHRASIFGFLLQFAVIGAGSSRADSAADSEALTQRIKAAFIYNFIQFTDWPDDALGDPESPIVIGVLEPDPLKGNLDRAILGKTAHGHNLAVRHITDSTQVAGCHLVYVCGDDQTVRKILESATGPTLTVGDSDAFAAAGGGIRFYVAENKIRFQIDLTTLEKAKLQMSSKLLKVARTVSH